MKTLNGKIYWVNFDFNLNGVYNPQKKDKTTFISTRISGVIIDEHMIKFRTEPYEYGNDGSVVYNVNLTINDNGKKYFGEFLEIDDASDGKCECELFENKTHYLLFGKWTEYDYSIEKEDIYSWWAKIEKQKKD